LTERIEARPAELEDVQLHWWAMYCSAQERRSPTLVEKFEGDFCIGGFLAVLTGSDDVWFDMVAVSERWCLEMVEGEE